MTPTETAEAKAEELADCHGSALISAVMRKNKSDYLVAAMDNLKQEFATLFLKADERDELEAYKNTAELHLESKDKAIENWRKAYTDLKHERDHNKAMWEGQINRSKLAEQERDSLREELEASQIQHRVVLVRLEELQDDSIKTLNELREKLELAQADCAVKHEALKRLLPDWDIPPDDHDGHIACEITNGDVKAITKALSTNSGQSLLDELKRAKEKAEALDWFENFLKQFDAGIEVQISDKPFILYDEHEREWNGETLLSAINQAKKEQGL